MSESKTDCPFCGRRPGTTHAHGCSRSRATIRSTAYDCAQKARPRQTWIFGPHVVFVPGKGNQITFNPGVPYVRKKPWYAGGKPAGAEEKTKAFMEKLEDIRARLIQQEVNSGIRQ